MQLYSWGRGEGGGGQSSLKGIGNINFLGVGLEQKRACLRIREFGILNFLLFFDRDKVYSTNRKLSLKDPSGLALVDYAPRNSKAKHFCLSWSLCPDPVVFSCSDNVSFFSGCTTQRYST